MRDLAEIAREECFSNLSAIEKQKKTSKNPNGTWARQQDYNNLIRILYRLDDVICRENQTLYNERVAILQGDGGIGKTHLLCDYASGRLNSNLPTFLFLSDDLSGRDPVIAIAKRLGFKSKKTFLKELRAFTLQQNNQTCFIVDAINENSAMAWKQILDLLQVPKVSVILSIRNGFEQVTKVKDWKIPRVWHHGFAEGKLEWEAMQKYFRHYNLSDIPDTPVLYEEFRNPLFLKVFCESYEGTSIGKKPRGHIMTNIFEQYVVEKTKIINKDLGVHLGKKDIWEGVVKPMSEYLGSHGVKLVIPSGQLYNIISNNTKIAVNARPLIESMCHNGILRKVTHYTKNYRRTGYDYEFVYHKFSDHVVVRYFLNTFNKAPKDDIPKLIAGSALFKQSLRRWNSGIIEALAIQYPERCKGEELVSIIPKRYRFSQMVWSAILDSIIWRGVRIKDGDYLNINPVVLEQYIMECNKYDGVLFKYLDTLITVGIIPEHPFNAEKFHQTMSRNPLPKRDAWWAEYTAFSGTEGDSFGRLCSWVFSEFGDAAGQAQKLLATIMLSWFLASTNRGVRDQASYAIIKLIRSDITTSLELLRRFENCDDQYILERLFLIVYNSTIYEKNEQKAFLELVQYIDKNVFQNPNRTPNIIIDQCARDIVALYQNRYGKLGLDLMRRITPPYNYKLTEKRLPNTKTILEKYGDESSENNCLSIIGSVLYPDAGIADFGNYTMGSILGNLTNIPLSEAIEPLAVQYDKFLKSLSVEQHEALDHYHSILHRSEDTVLPSIVLKIMGHPKQKGIFNGNRQQVIPASATEKDVKQAKNDFISLLSQKQKRMFTDKIAQNIFNDRSPFTKYTHRDYDISWAQRWLFLNTLRLGWHYDLHGKFDMARYHYDHMRGSSDIARLERVGKKYQWISLHQFMALASSKYRLNDRWSGNVLPKIYRNSIEFNDRNFDPTIPTSWVINHNGHLHQPDEIIDENVDTNVAQSKSWWKPNHKILDTDSWLLSCNDVPDLRQLVHITSNSKHYLSLINWPTWRKTYSKTKWRQLWIQVSSYIVKIGDLQKIKNWHNSDDFDSTYDDFPGLQSYDDVFLGEIIRETPVYNMAVERMPSIEYATEKRPFQVMPTIVDYNGGCFELGPIMQHRVEIPSPFLRNILNLKSNDGISYTNMMNGYKVFCPSLTLKTDDQFILLASKNIIDALASHGYTILWTEIGEKQELGDLHSAPDSICIRGYAYMENGHWVASTKFYKISEKFKRKN